MAVYCYVVFQLYSLAGNPGDPHALNQAQEQNAGGGCHLIGRPTLSTLDVQQNLLTRCTEDSGEWSYGTGYRS
jgi:hypothetical protein